MRARAAAVLTFVAALIAAALIPYLWPVQPSDPFDLAKRLAFAVIGGLILHLAYRAISGRQS